MLLVFLIMLSSTIYMAKTFGDFAVLMEELSGGDAVF